MSSIEIWLHQHNAAPWRIHFLPHLAIRLARRQTETAMDARLDRARHRLAKRSDFVTGNRMEHRLTVSNWRKTVCWVHCRFDCLGNFWFASFAMPQRSGAAQSEPREFHLAQYRIQAIAVGSAFCRQGDKSRVTASSDVKPNCVA